MRHEPSRFVGHAEHAVDLMAADAFLAGAEQVHRLKPQVQRDMRRMENRADRDAELALARAAPPQAGAPAPNLRDPVETAAARAYRTMRP
jgi:hypothetical protein